MTSKQIADSLGKPDKTVRTWVSNTAARSATIAAKLAASNSTHPADYTLAETCDIIEQGMGKDVADTFRTNAASAQVVATAKKPLLPSGAQLNALCWIYGKSEAAKRIDFAMGYQGAKSEPAPIYMIEARGIGPISKQAWAVEMKVRANAEAQYEQARLTPELGL